MHLFHHPLKCQLRIGWCWACGHMNGLQLKPAIPARTVMVEALQSGLMQDRLMQRGVGRHGSSPVKCPAGWAKRSSYFLCSEQLAYFPPYLAWQVGKVPLAKNAILHLSLWEKHGDVGARKTKSRQRCGLSETVYTSSYSLPTWPSQITKPMNTVACTGCAYTILACSVLNTHAWDCEYWDNLVQGM